MSEPLLPRKRLPVKPSQEHLRKQAKRRVKLDPSLQLSDVQQEIAQEYGCKNWAELLHVVETMNRGAEQLSFVKYQMEALPWAANANDLAGVVAILQSGEFTQHDLDLALGRAVLRYRERSEIARVLLNHGADPDGQYGSNYGPIVFVTGESLDPDGLQFLIDAGADVTFTPIETKYGRQCPMSSFLGTYLRGKNDAKHRGIQILLTHGAHVPAEITPPMMAIHAGDAKLLGQQLDADASLAARRFSDMPYGNIALRGATLLHAAAEFDEMSCVMELLNHGVDVNITADVIDGHGKQTPVFHSANNGRVELTRRLLQAGAVADVADNEGNTPLFLLCKSRVNGADRLAIAKLLISHGAAVRRGCENQSTALHQAAQIGPVEMVELLIRHGAKEWQADKHGKKPIDEARAGSAVDKDLIIELLDRPVIRDATFKSAVAAIHNGDLSRLQAILKAHPSVVHDRAIEPDCYPASYFSNPKLIWFVANNPKLVESIPVNIVQIAEAVIDTGAAAEDLNYTLELVMTSASAGVQNQRNALMKLLLERGAVPGDLLAVLGHCELEPARFLVANGVAITAPIAAALDRIDELETLLATVDAATRQAAFGIAVINRRAQAARLCLLAGADVNQFLPVHAHSMAVHQAAVNDDVEMLQLLVDFNARLDLRDTLWNSTPLGWAIHTGKQAAERYLRAAGAV